MNGILVKQNALLHWVLLDRKDFALRLEILIELRQEDSNPHEGDWDQDHQQGAGNVSLDLNAFLGSDSAAILAGPRINLFVVCLREGVSLL